MTSTNNNQNINPKSCVYNCNTQIYWNVATNEYWEVFTKKKHICPNRVNKPSTITTNSLTGVSNKPTYYSKKTWNSQPKPKMSNSFELLIGPTVAEIQKKYEILSDIVSEYNGKVHGSQRDRESKTGIIDLLVYYEVLLGQREEVKRKFDNVVLHLFQ
ncbi:MAG: hypothetical protein ACXWEW_11200 [Nitrososphaeraceae archaeon]